MLQKMSDHDREIKTRFEILADDDNGDVAGVFLMVKMMSIGDVVGDVLDGDDESVSGSIE